MQIEIVKVEVENKGKYRVANVVYKDSNGRVDAKKPIMSFTHKEVFKTLSEAKLGDKFEVKAEKNDKGYWDWTEISSAGKNESPSGSNYSTSVSKGGNWETAEERAKKQVYIVRQSSLSNAISFLNEHVRGDVILTEEDVIQTAKRFEEYVFGIEPVVEMEIK